MSLEARAHEVVGAAPAEPRRPPRAAGASMHGSLRQTTIYALTIAGGQALSFLLLPIVTGFLLPEVFGDYTLALVISNLVATFGSSWVRNVAFRLFYEARDAGRTRSFFVTVAVLQVVLVTALYTPTAIVLTTVVHYVAPSVMLAAVVTLLTGDFFDLSVSLVRAERQAGQFAVADLGAGGLRFGLTLAGLLLGLRSPVLLFAAAAVAAASAGLYAALVLRRRLTGPARLDVALVRRFVRLGPAALPFSVSAWGQRLLDRLVLDHYATRVAVGIYSVNYVLAERIVGGLASAVFMMAWPDVLHAWTDAGKPAAREALSRGLRLYLWLTVGPAVFIGMFSGDLARLTGVAYRGGAAIMPFVALATWLSGFNVYLNRHLELGLRFGALSGVSIACALLNLILNLVLVPAWGIRGAALATLASSVAAGIVFWLIRDRELVRLPRRDIATIALLLAAAILCSRAPPAGELRAATFVAVYGAGAAYFVTKHIRKRGVRAA